ncbi:hypothetical protein FS837_000873 [Tulasnella sp. UAMH 9824]|nr:hypothetical protein FS837_000873 [Tulasnella sp. UAMH 9824]
MSSQLQQVSNTPSGYELISSGPNFVDDLSSLAFNVSLSNNVDRELDILCSSVPRSFSRRQDSQIVPPTLAYPPFATNTKTHSIIIAIAKGDPAEPALAGVAGDFPLILDELTARTTASLQVITDLQVPRLASQAKTFPPSVQSVGDAIRNVGQAMNPGSTCFVYLSGHAYAYEDSLRTSFMPLPSGERLDGKRFGSQELMGWLKAAASNGGTFILIADVCHAAGFIQMPFIYDVNGGSLSWSKSVENQVQLKSGQMIALLSTDYNQFAVTIDSGTKEPYPGYHGLFTFALFDYLRKQPLEIDTANLLLHLRKHSSWHPSQPRPQIFATIEGLRQLALGRPPT